MSNESSNQYQQWLTGKLSPDRITNPVILDLIHLKHTMRETGDALMLSLMTEAANDPVIPPDERAVWDMCAQILKHRMEVGYPHFRGMKFEEVNDHGQA